MADKKISELSAVTDVVSGDEYVLSRSGVSKKIDADDLSAGIAALYPPSDAADVGVADTGNNYTATDVEGVLAEIAPQLGAGGGMVIIHDETLSGTQASFDVTSISGSYTNLRIVMSALPLGSNGDLYMRFNNDTGSNYEWSTAVLTTGFTGINVSTSDTKIKVDTIDTNARYVLDCEVLDYADTGIHKYVIGQATRVGATMLPFSGRWKSNSAITRVTLLLSTGSFVSGSRCRIYGIPAA